MRGLDPRIPLRDALAILIGMRRDKPGHDQLESWVAMSDIAQLEDDLLAAVASAKDEAALEAVRVAALGKSGSVSALLKTLGAMTPDERKVQGPAINGLKDRVTAAIAARKDALAGAALDARLNTETVDVTLAGARSAGRDSAACIRSAR